MLNRHQCHVLNKTSFKTVDVVQDFERPENRQMQVNLFQEYAPYFGLNLKYLKSDKNLALYSKENLRVSVNGNALITKV